MGSDLEIVLNRGCNAFTTTDLTRIFNLGWKSIDVDNSYAGGLTGLHAFITPSGVEVHIGQDGACAFYFVEVVAVAISTLLQAEVKNVASTLVDVLKSSTIIFIPDDIDPFSDLRDGVMSGELTVDQMAEEIIRQNLSAIDLRNMIDESMELGSHKLLIQCSRAMLLQRQEIYNWLSLGK